MNYKIIALLIGVASLFVGCDQDMTTEPASNALATGLVKVAPVMVEGAVSFKEASSYQNEGYVIVGYADYSLVDGPMLRRDQVEVTIKANLQILPENPKMESLYVAKGSLDRVFLGEKRIGYLEVMYPLEKGGFAVWISYKITGNRLSIDNVRLDDIKG